jgi:hypothetical protein
LLALTTNFKVGEDNKPDSVVITQVSLHPIGLWPDVSSVRMKAHVKDIAIDQKQF